MTIILSESNRRYDNLLGEWQSPDLLMGYRNAQTRAEEREYKIEEGYKNEVDPGAFCEALREDNDRGH